MYTLDDILDDSSKFQNGMFFSVFHNLYLYCSRVFLQARFFKGLGSTLHGQHTTLLCITFMTSQSHLWRYCCIMTSHDPWLLRRCFKRGFGDHRKQRIYEFNWVVISIEMQLIKTSNRLAEIITLFVCKYSFKQQSLFKSNLARLNDGGSSPSVGVTNSCEVIEIIFFHSVLRKNRNDGTFIISFPSAFNNKVIFHSDGCVFLVRPKQDVSFLWSHDLSRDWQKVDRNGHAFRRDWMG